MPQTELDTPFKPGDAIEAPPPADWSQALDNPVADKRLDVLRRVALGDSISQAAREVGISYKAAWQAIDTLTNLSGVSLVERTVGGVGGGGARITPQGLQLLALADALARAREQVLAQFGNSAAHLGGLGLRTSMRNQLPCRVTRCDALAPHDPMARVHLHTPGGAMLTASLTRESADLLGLVPGLAVLALCKATAVQVQLAQAGGAASSLEADPSVCLLAGVVARVAGGSDQDEVVLALDGGGSWVGFAAHPFTGQAGDAAVARMSASALVVALPG